VRAADSEKLTSVMITTVKSFTAEVQGVSRKGQLTFENYLKGQQKLEKCEKFTKTFFLFFFQF
jgi:hypothetical protein